MSLMPGHYDKMMEDMFRGEKFDSILDIGCGPLQYIETIKKNNPQARVDGFDCDAGMVALAQSRLKEFDMKGEVVLHHAQTEPWPFSGKYDAVAIIAVLLILNDNYANILMRNARKACKKRLLILDIHDPEAIGQVERARNFLEFLPKFGFKNISIEEVSGWPGSKQGHIIKANVCRSHSKAS